MAKRIQNFAGIFGDQKEPFEKFFVHHEPLQKRSALYNFEIKEHLHSNLVQLFLITSGGGLLLSLGKKITLDIPCILVIPSNVLHGFVFSSEVKGEVFTISDSQFEQCLKNAPALFSSFGQLQQITFDSGADRFLELLRLKDRIIHELNHPDKATEFNIDLLLQLLLVNLYRSKKENQIDVIETDDKTLRHFHSFKKLIKQNVHEDKAVQSYAREMNLTAVHLNRICKAVAKKTALQIIHEHVVQEAKKYLKGTAYSIAEIAYFMDFKNPAHFSKFFKKNVGKTPSSFREDE